MWQLSVEIGRFASKPRRNLIGVMWSLNRLVFGLLHTWEVTLFYVLPRIWQLRVSNCWFTWGKRRNVIKIMKSLLLKMIHLLLVFFLWHDCDIYNFVTRSTIGQCIFIQLTTNDLTTYNINMESMQAKSKLTCPNLIKF